MNTEINRNRISVCTNGCEYFQLKHTAVTHSIYVCNCGKGRLALYPACKWEWERGKFLYSFKHKTRLLKTPYKNSGGMVGFSRPNKNEHDRGWKYDY